MQINEKVRFGILAATCEVVMWRVVKRLTLFVLRQLHNNQYDCFRLFKRRNYANLICINAWHVQTIE